MPARGKKSASTGRASSNGGPVGAPAAGSASGPPATGFTPGAATRAAEIETKLEIEPDADLPDLRRRRSLGATGIDAVAEPQTYDLDATYYDTAGLDLLRSKMTLRRRTGGKDAGWHLKLPAAAGARTEVGLPLSAGEPGDVPAELAGLVRGAARGRPLVPVARLENARVVRHLLDRDGGTLIEVADDHVRATPLLEAGDDPIAAPSQWREVEVEIVDGTADQLAATVQVLLHAGAQPASSVSKLARALRTDAAEAPADPARRGRSAGSVIVAALGRQRDLLIAADRGVRDGGADALADAYSAARRVRAVLAVYSPLFDGPDPRSLRRRLRDLGGAVNAAADAETARRRLLAHLADEPEDYAAHARIRLQVAFDARVADAMAAVRDRLDGEDYLQLLRDLDAFVAAPPLSKRAARPGAAELADLIGAGWGRLRARADIALADPGNVPAVHAVRRTAATVRYAAEAAIAAIGDNAVVFAAAIEDVQEALAEYQDAGVAANLLAEFAAEPGTDGMAGFTFGRLHAFEQAMAHGALDEFADAWDRVEDGDLAATLAR